MEKTEHTWKIPFKTPVDYFKEVLDGDYNAIDHFAELHKQKKGWRGYDCDLHVYPYIKARPAMLSVGCPNHCSFCPTAQVHGGRIHFGNPEVIIPRYIGECIHFMDENFFYNDMRKVLPLLKRWKVRWLAMSDYKSTLKTIEEFGEDYLYECGLRVVEIGLENVVLCRKVKERIPVKRVVINYLNMTCLPGETKASIAENARWMKPVSLKRPIHFNNGVWYACGQFFYPYEPVEGGRNLSGGLARVKPSWVPNSLAVQNYEIVDLERANYYSQLVYGIKLYNPRMSGIIGSFIANNQNAATWLLSGLRCGAII